MCKWRGKKLTLRSRRRHGSGRNAIGRGNQPGLLLPALALAQHPQGEDGEAEDRGGAEAELDAEQPFAGPVDVAEVEQEGRLVEGEAHADAHRHREVVLELLVFGQQRGRARGEGDQDAGYEVMDVAAADADVAE